MNAIVNNRHIYFQKASVNEGKAVFVNIQKEVAKLV